MHRVAAYWKRCSVTVDIQDISLGNNSGAPFRNIGGVGTILKLLRNELDNLKLDDKPNASGGAERAFCA
jgi:hypothetical protein